MIPGWVAAAGVASAQPSAPGVSAGTIVVEARALPTEGSAGTIHVESPRPVEDREVREGAARIADLAPAQGRIAVSGIPGVATGSVGVVGFGGPRDILMNLSHPDVSIGVAVERISDELRDQLPQLKPAAGLIIRHVMDKSDAANAGLQKGDILLTWNGDSLVHPEQLRVLVQSAKPSQEINVTYLRKGTEQQAKLTLSKAPERADGAIGHVTGEAIVLDRVLEDGGRVNFKFHGGERDQIREKLEALKGRIEGIRKEIPKEGNQESGLSKEIEALEREVGKLLEQGTDTHEFRAEAMLLDPEGRVEPMKRRDLEEGIRRAMREAGIEDKVADEVRKELKEAPKQGGIQVQGGGKIIVVGPEGKIIEREFDLRKDGAPIPAEP